MASPIAGSLRTSDTTETALDQHALERQVSNTDEMDEAVLEEVLGHASAVNEQGGGAVAPVLPNVNKDDTALEMEEEPKDGDFAVGDHVYQWCSFAGIPGMFQHHGIVIQAMDGHLTIADFSGMISASSQSNNNNDDGDTQQLNPAPAKKSLFSSRSLSAMREYTVSESKEQTKWKKVRYSAGFLRRTFCRSGTCTSVESDPPGLVLARVQYLLDHQDQLPPYHVLKSNCECVAVWCKTGQWATLQASSFLEVTAAGQVKSASTLALYVSHQTVTVPAAGVWGWMGFTTKVSLLSTQPYLIPILVGYGIFSVGGPVWVLHRCKHAWNETSTKLNDAFWESALDRPDVFVECITHWSDL